MLWGTLHIKVHWVHSRTFAEQGRGQWFKTLYGMSMIVDNTIPHHVKSITFKQIQSNHVIAIICKPIHPNCLMLIILRYTHTDLNHVMFFPFSKPLHLCDVHSFKTIHSHGVNVTHNVSGSTRLNIACHTDIYAPAAVTSPVTSDVSITSDEGLHGREQGKGSGSSRMIDSACGTLIISLLHKI